MNREEAIKWLKAIEKKYIHGGDEEYDNLRKIALHMAIEALKQSTQTNVPNVLNALDTISRRAAIDAIRRIKANYCETADDQVLLIDKAMAMTELMMLPSTQPEILACGSGELNAQSEQRWIPVTERLPEIDMSHPHHEDYLVQYDSGGIDVASWSNVNRFWTDHVTEPHWNCVQFAKVIAWMPLPEPYKGGEQNDDNGTDRIIEKA